MYIVYIVGIVFLYYLPDKTVSSILEILFLVRMSLTILVMLVKAPFWISWIKLLVRFTDKSLGCVDRASGVSRSAKGDDSMIFFLCPISRMTCLYWPRISSFLTISRYLLYAMLVVKVVGKSQTISGLWSFLKPSYLNQVISFGFVYYYLEWLTFVTL